MMVWLSHTALPGGIELGPRSGRKSIAFRQTWLESIVLWSCGKCAFLGRCIILGVDDNEKKCGWGWWWGWWWRWLWWGDRLLAEGVRYNLCSSHAFSLSEFLFLIFIVSTINLEHISNKCNSHTLSPWRCRVTFSSVQPARNISSNAGHTHRKRWKRWKVWH